MSARRASLLLCAMSGMALLACMFALAFVVLRLPLAHQQARQRWQMRGPHHYELEATWASGMSYGHVRAEMRDNQIVAGVDLDSGRSLSGNRLAVASYYTSIDNLFNTIDRQLQPASTWRYQLARYHRRLARWLDPCAALLPQIEYDSELGYPASIDFHGSPCFNYHESMLVKISHFRALP